jgi:primosomal protein N' (replication factor Y)
MREERCERDHFISPTLREAVARAVAGGQQAMLFLNRRGYAPLVLCRKCGHRFQCPHCSAWLVLHKKGARMQCHHCDYHIAVPPACPECKAEGSLHACGPGVERVHEEVMEFLPQARVATLASDSTANHKELEAIIGAMEAREIDVLIGTQMIAKGHHFGGLSVVGVVDADLGLAGGDLRATEKTYQLLHQISGRAGREQTHGHVYLQSYMPEHPVMKALASGGRDAFFATELAARQHAHMPPFSRLAALIIEGHKEAEVIAVCKALSMQQATDSTLHSYGPAPAPLALLRGKFRYRFLVNAARSVNLPDYMRSWVASIKAPRSVRIKIDIDPMSFL